jgi:DNA-binding CsgD family transcriptional regulator
MNSFPYVSPREKLLLRRFAAGKTDREIAADLGDTECRIVAQRQRIVEKFEIRTHEQLVALARQLAVWPGANSQNLKVSGGRDRRRARTIDATEIKKMRAAGMGSSSIAKALKICRASVYRALGN